MLITTEASQQRLKEEAQSSNAGTSVGDINAGFDVGALDNSAQNDGGVYKDRKVGSQ